MRILITVILASMPRSCFCGQPTGTGGNWGRGLQSWHQSLWRPPCPGRACIPQYRLLFYHLPHPMPRNSYCINILAYFPILYLIKLIMSYKSDLDLLMPLQVSYLKLSCNLCPLKPTPSHPPTTPAGTPSHTCTLALLVCL